MATAPEDIAHVQLPSAEDLVRLAPEAVADMRHAHAVLSGAAAARMAGTLSNALVPEFTKLRDALGKMLVLGRQPLSQPDAHMRGHRACFRTRVFKMYCLALLVCDPPRGCISGRHPYQYAVLMQHDLVPSAMPIAKWPYSTLIAGIHVLAVRWPALQFSSVIAAYVRELMYAAARFVAAGELDSTELDVPHYREPAGAGAGVRLHNTAIDDLAAIFGDMLYSIWTYTWFDRVPDPSAATHTLVPGRVPAPGIADMARFNAAIENLMGRLRNCAVALAGSDFMELVLEKCVVLNQWPGEKARFMRDFEFEPDPYPLFTASRSKPVSAQYAKHMMARSPAAFLDDASAPPVEREMLILMLFNNICIGELQYEWMRRHVAFEHNFFRDITKPIAGTPPILIQNFHYTDVLMCTEHGMRVFSTRNALRAIFTWLYIIHSHLGGFCGNADFVQFTRSIFDRPPATQPPARTPSVYML